jgi:4-azaleucine resistance transporter AzlC
VDLDLALTKPGRRNGVDRYQAGARAALPVGIAAFVFGGSFGVLASSAGMGWLAPVVMSATTFAGSAQFAVATLLAQGGIGGAIVAAMLLNARYAPLGIAAAPAFRGPPYRRLAEAQLIVDESWALANRGGGRFDYYALVGAGSLLWVAWVGGTVLGVAAGEALGSPESFGLDAAFAALFLYLLTRQLGTRDAPGVALLGAAVALALVPLAPAGVPIIAGSAACLVGLLRR